MDYLPNFCWGSRKGVAAVLRMAIITGLLGSAGVAVAFPQTEGEGSSSPEVLESTEAGSKLSQEGAGKETGKRERSTAEWNPDLAFGTDPDYVIGRFVIPAVIFLIAVLALSLVVIFHAEPKSDQVRIRPSLREQRQLTQKR